MLIVNWAREIKKLYAEVRPGWNGDVDELLSLFQGYEEALWLALCHRFGCDPSRVTFIDESSRTNIMQTRFRIMRIYCRYAPPKLLEIDTVVALAERNGEQSILHRLVNKYGPEPQQTDLSVKERVIMWFAYYNQCSRIDSADKLVSAFEGHAEALFERLTVDLGPEPRIEMCSDPREPRARLIRILQVYDPSMLPRLEGLLARYQDNFIRLFGTLQRRYGREPSAEVLRAFREKEQIDNSASSSSAASGMSIVRLLQEADAEARRREQLAARALEIVEASANNQQLTSLRDVNFQRHSSLGVVRAMIREEDTYTAEQLTEVTENIFRAYQRLLVPGAAELVSHRFGAVKEVSEWLSFLDYMFANEAPHSDAMTLRQLVSLLDIQHGERLSEVTAAGGVEPFLGGIRREAQKDWFQYLVTAHGMPEERTIGIRNRRVAHYLFYNPSKTVRDAEVYLTKAQRIYPLVDEALVAAFGEEPPPPPVSLERVRKVLARYAPHRLPYVADVIEAHCLPRDRSEDVMRRICRTYGPELALVYADMERLFVEECERRFQIFSAEGRMRDIFVRRFAAALDSGSDIYRAIEQRAAQEASLKLELQLQRLRKQQEELETLKKAKAAAAAMDNQSLYVEAVFKEEELERLHVVEDEQEAAEEIRSILAAVLDMWDEGQNLELAELLKRLRIEDQWRDDLVPIHEQKRVEEAELKQFLAQREPWRRKWLADEEARDAALERHVAEQRARQLEVEQIRADAVLVASAFSDTREHELLMKARFDELNAQAVHVLTYAAELQRKRAEVRLNGSRIAAAVTTHRGVHERCGFARANYTVTVEEKQLRPTFAALLEDDAATKRELVQTQLLDYLSSLFRTHEPSRCGTEAQLLRQYEGKEGQLILGLEQRYNVHHWLEKQAREKLVVYLEKLAPHLKDEADTIMRRFSGQEEAMWRYLEQVYGPPPQLQSREMRLYLKNRLVRYLHLRAPHLLLDADMMLDRCEDNGDEMFRKLTAEYGPETRDASKELLERKLRAFYKRRDMRRTLESVSALAARYVGREQVLNKLLLEKFGDTCENETPDTDEFLL